MGGKSILVLLGLHPRNHLEQYLWNGYRYRLLTFRLNLLIENWNFRINFIKSTKWTLVLDFSSNYQVLKGKCGKWNQANNVMDTTVALADIINNKCTITNISSYGGIFVAYGIL